MSNEEIELNLIILDAIKLIASKSNSKISFDMKTIEFKKTLVNKNPTEKTYINIELTKSL